MAMLAERKRKQKWSLNPRGNSWVQDSNKFGQKMLEKMGWQHGKGLGSKEDGITEHVKVSYKNDSKGMGYKETDDQWTEHESNFTALLESLSGEKPDDIKFNSLEKKSQSSRARVHYHKFTRGKDLSRYSEKDLANIFGKKSLKDLPKVKVEETKVDETEANENKSKFLFNAGSMHDYFKKKLPNFGKSNGYAIAQNGVFKKEESDNEIDVRPSFKFSSEENNIEETSYTGFGFKNDVKRDESIKTTFISYVSGNNEPVEKKSKKKRKPEVHEADDVLSPKKKSRKNKNDVTESDKGVSNPAFNPLSTPVKVQKHVLDTIEESVSEDLTASDDDDVKHIETSVQVHVSLPRKKKHLSESSSSNVESEKCKMTASNSKNGIENRIFVDNDMVDLTMNGDKENEVDTSAYEVKRKKKKVTNENLTNFEELKVKKKKKEDNERVENGSIDLTTDESSVSSTAENTLSKSKKKKKQNAFAENPSFENVLENSVDLTHTEENPYEVKLKKKKKKTPAFDNLNFTESGEAIENVSQNEENPYEEKITPKKKKKKDQNYAIENPNFNESIEEPCNDIEENPFEVKITQKKKKKKDDQYAIENPNFNESIEEPVCNKIEENPFEVKITQKKKKKTKKGDQYAIENPNFDESIEEPTCNKIEENPFEVKITQKKKKKKKNDQYAIENPNFNESLEEDASNNLEENPYEVKPKKKKKKKEDNTLALNNSNFNPNEESSTNKILEIERKNTNFQENTDESISLNIEESDLMLNVVTTPILKRSVNGDETYTITQISSVKRRKSVRFSDVTQERIIPNNDELRRLSDIENRNELFEINNTVINNSLKEQGIDYAGTKLGLDNAAFDKHKTNLEENLDAISKTIDRYEAEIENDINEKKLETMTMEDYMIGEVGNPHGENEKIPEGTKLKFKFANFTSRTPFYHLDKTGSKKSYKHLIKGDVIVGFKNTNLHEIHGYAAKISNV